MALLSLWESEITREPGCAIFSSSPMVLTLRRCGEAPEASPAPTSLVAGSSTAVTFRFSARSYQSLPMMPLSAGGAPLSIAAWPTAVTEGSWSRCALVKTAPSRVRRRKPPVNAEAKRGR
jgi:hypothetical protein